MYMRDWPGGIMEMGDHLESPPAEGRGGGGGRGEGGGDRRRCGKDKTGGRRVGGVGQ